ncbi:MAG: hypothetical protein K5917_02355 [Clostridiales bacterium]|nr:hypothetical protein [Clostridiales bacterium]
MSLEDLGREYLEQYKIIKEKLFIEREKIKKGEVSNLMMQRQKINLLYIMARDCKRTADKLLNYYKREE